MTYVSDEFAADEGLGTLFEDVVVYEGTQADTTSGDLDPQFKEYGALLTDGQDYWLYDKGYYAGGIYGATSFFGVESDRLILTISDGDAVDLQGYAIESVTRIMTATFDSPGSDPNGDGNWTDFWIEGTFEIYGHPIPEPATLGLLLVATGAALARRRRTGR